MNEIDRILGAGVGFPALSNLRIHQQIFRQGGIWLCGRLSPNALQALDKRLILLGEVARNLDRLLVGQPQWVRSSLTICNI